MSLTKKIQNKAAINDLKQKIKNLEYQIDVTAKFIDQEGLLKEYMAYIKELQKDG